MPGRSARRADAVLGVVSLVIWALTLIVTVKYVIFLMRADNKGEGGTLALMALAQRAIGRRTRSLILFIGMVGASLFYGDGMITPAISVLSAVEGVRDSPGHGSQLRALRAAERGGHPDRALPGAVARHAPGRPRCSAR